MKAKRLLKFIRTVNYTVDYEKNDIPLTAYDEGFKVACNLIIGGIKGLSWTPMRNFYHSLWIWRNKARAESSSAAE